MSSQAIFSSPYAETNVTLCNLEYFQDSANKLYFMVGRGYRLSDTENLDMVWPVNDAEPPVPANTPNAIKTLWDDLLYGREINKNNINLVMPSIQGGQDIFQDWATRTASERTFDPWNPDTPFTFGFTQNRFYVNDQNQVFLNLKVGGDTVPNVEAQQGEPTLTGAIVDTDYFNDGTLSITTLGSPGVEDVWKYLYTIHEQSSLIPIAGPIENNYWVPINYNTKTNPDDVPNLPYIIGARNITINISLPTNFDEIEFRQNWIVVNPTGTNLVGENQNDKSLFDLYSGHVLYIEHRPPQIKQTNQEERILIAFTY